MLAWRNKRCQAECDTHTARPSRGMTPARSANEYARREQSAIIFLAVCSGPENYGTSLKRSTSVCLGARAITSALRVASSSATLRLIGSGLDPS